MLPARVLCRRVRRLLSLPMALVCVGALLCARSLLGQRGGDAITGRPAPALLEVRSVPACHRPPPERPALTRCIRCQPQHMPAPTAARGASVRQPAERHGLAPSVRAARRASAEGGECAFSADGPQRLVDDQGDAIVGAVPVQLVTATLRSGEAGCLLCPVQTKTVRFEL